jgi:hypothetical protein
MQRPIIDPDKVNAWTASMRDAFGGSGSDLGTWIAIAIITIALAAIVWSAWWGSRHREKSGL